MKLSNMIRKPTAQKLNKVTESRFGFKIDYNAMTLPKAHAMRNKIYETVNSIRNSSAVHTAEKNPQYLEMLIVYEGLSRFIDASNKRNLTEGELGQAQAILAAKDMVDTVQDLIEKVGKMQNEQLPALIDSIRDQIGSEQADTFKGTVGTSLATLASALGQTRESLDSSTRGLTGEGAPDMGGLPPGGDDMGADAAAAGLPPMAGVGPEAPPDMDDGMGDGFDGADAAAGGNEQLGRERR